jgi:hypothetical protein
MQYFYIELSNGDVYGSFDSKAEALRYVNNAGFTHDWKIVETSEEHDGVSDAEYFSQYDYECNPD